MVVIKGKFAPRTTSKQEDKVDSTDKMMKDLGLDNLVVVGPKIVAYYNHYEGKDYFHIRSVWQKHGQWRHGKGLSVDLAGGPGVVKELLTNLGELGGKL